MSDWNQQWLAALDRNLKRAEDRKVIASSTDTQRYIDEVYLIALLTVERDARLAMIAAAEKEAA